MKTLTCLGIHPAASITEGLCIYFVTLTSGVQSLLYPVNIVNNHSACRSGTPSTADDTEALPSFARLSNKVEVLFISVFASRARIGGKPFTLSCYPGHINGKNFLVSY